MTSEIAAERQTSIETPEAGYPFADTSGDGDEASGGMRFDRVVWIVLAIVAVAAALRFWDLGLKAIHHDESLHATYSWYFSRLAPIYKHDPLMHGPFQFHAMALVFKLFGDSDYTARIPAALADTALVATPLLLRRWLGSVGTVAAAVFLCVSPAVLYYSRFAREDIYIGLWTVLMFIGVWRYRDDGRDRWLVLTAAGLALSFATKESAYLTAAILLLYTDITLTFALLDQRGTRGWDRLREGILLAPVAWLIVALWGGTTSLRERLRFTSIPREGDLLIVIGILTLPQLAAAVELPLMRMGIEVTGALEVRVRVISISLLLAAAMMTGMFWDTRRWAIVSLVFYGITIPLFTTEFTNFRGGITSDLWGALDYWIEQQGVRRGEQPWFYYLMMLPIYEFVTLIPALIGGWWLLERGNRFAALLVTWFAGTFIALTYAGEKMPWLVVHLAIPLALLAALTVNEGVAWIRAHRGSMRATAIAPLAAGIGVLLLGLSVRNALGVSFGHPDTPVEPLIYTQTAPDVPKLSKRIHELAAQQPDKRLTVIVDDAEGASWPWAWYLRDIQGVTYTPATLLQQTWKPGAIVLAMPGDLDAAGTLRAQAGAGEPYHHRWWFPEEGYKSLTGAQLASDIVTGRLFVRWAQFEWRHYSADSLGSLNGEAIFPATPGAAGGATGPQPSTPR